MKSSDVDSAGELTRRQFVGTTAASAALLVVRCAGGNVSTKVPVASASAPEPTGSGPFTLAPLPWAEDALEPYISARTIGFHHGKHHAGYVSKLNAAVQGSPLAQATLEEVIIETAVKPEMAGIFNNAAQTHNHALFFASMKPGGGGEPPAQLAARLESSFGSVQAFKDEFSSAAASQFGSGWAWLALDGEDLVVVKTPNADTPLSAGMRPLLTLDVWEHSYYLDWQNRRTDYIAAWLEHLVNWDLALDALT